MRQLFQQFFNLDDDEPLGPTLKEGAWMLLYLASGYIMLVLAGVATTTGSM